MLCSRRAVNWSGCRASVPGAWEILLKYVALAEVSAIWPKALCGVHAFDPNLLRGCTYATPNILFSFFRLHSLFYLSCCFCEPCAGEARVLQRATSRTGTIPCCKEAGPNHGVHRKPRRAR